MSLGQLARRALGDRFQPIGERYRAIFVDLDKVVAAMSRAIPPGAHCLDVGGGDGMVCNLLLDRRPDIRITMTDIAPAIGGFIAPEHLHRVERRPGTALDTIGHEGERFDAVLMADVLHHVPEAERPGFFRDLAEVCRRCGSRVLIIKDIEPGSLRSALSVLSDKYVTGDRSVALISGAELRAGLARVFPAESIGRIDLTFPDPPNYCAVLRLDG